MTAEKKRIELLDAFRFLAITAVVLYHYYSCWTPPAYPVNMYPYGDKFADLFRYGNLGVQFFFIISGFVILYTLENSPSLVYFFKRRFSRLFPPMLLCSVVVFLFTAIADPADAFNFHKGLACFLPSLTFTKPEIWNAIFNTDSFKWVSTVHWSLWYEIQFYLLIGVLFFSFRQRFVHIYTGITVALIASYWLVNSAWLASYFVRHNTALVAALSTVATGLQQVYRFFDLPMQLGYFGIGVFGYLLYSQRKLPTICNAMFWVLIVFQFYIQPSSPERVVYVIMAGIFLLFVAKSKLPDFLNLAFVNRIGIISYSLYLIHNETGIILINKIAAVLPVPSYLIPIVVYGIMILFAEFSFRYYEKHATQLMLKGLNKPK